jgi:hypothetical protein
LVGWILLVCWGVAEKSVEFYVIFGFDIDQLISFPFTDWVGFLKRFFGLLEG